MYNNFFNLKPEDNSFMLPELLKNLINYISKVTLDNAKNKFNLRNHFVLPESPMDRFVNDLNSPPFNANKQFEPNVMEELGRRYVGTTGFNRVNTNQFCFDIETKELKLREKDLLMNELKKGLAKKNASLKQIFAQAIPDVVKFQMDQLTPREFFSLFLFLECKTVTEV